MNKNLYTNEFTYKFTKEVIMKLFTRLLFVRYTFLHRLVYRSQNFVQIRTHCQPCHFQYNKVATYIPCLRSSFLPLSHSKNRRHSFLVLEFGWQCALLPSRRRSAILQFPFLQAFQQDATWIYQWSPFWVSIHWSLPLSSDWNCTKQVSWKCRLPIGRK